MPLRTWCVAGLAVIGLALAGCQVIDIGRQPFGAGRETAGQQPRQPTALVLATRDFGATPVLRRRIVLGPGTTVMSALKSVAKVETKYNGQFVNAINGVRSTYKGTVGLQKDWFYYVNGVMVEVGAAASVLQSGDNVWWDYHWWSFEPAVKANAGYLATLMAAQGPRRAPTFYVLYGRGMKNDARRLARRLSNVGGQKTRLARLGPRPPAGNIVAVGAWEDLSTAPWVQTATLAGKVASIFVIFDSTGAPHFQLLTDTGTPGTTVGPGSGIIMAIGGGDGRTALWLVTGTDRAAASRAANLLLGRPRSLERYFGVAIDPRGHLVRIPVLKP